jgi:hypothetical protein
MSRTPSRFYRARVLATMAALLFILEIGVVPARVSAQAPAATSSPEAEAQQVNGPPSISLTPALISVHAKGGQAFSQDLTLWNNTNLKLAFQMEARDVVIRDGKRLFLAAGETEGSIARYAVFNAKTVTVLPGAYVTVTVTVTVPSMPGPRAIVCLFMGKTIVATHSSLAMTGSMGALFTFTLSDDLHIESEPLQVSIDGDAKSVTFRQGLKNIGTDPVLPKGVLAVTNENGTLVAQLPVSGQRLLPGESLEVTAEHAGLFKAGRYRVMCLMENESSFFANAARFTIK